MDRRRALLLYAASAVAAINAALLAYWPYGVGPYLGLYAIAYAPAAWYARAGRGAWAIAAALLASFIAYSLWIALRAMGY